MSYTLPEPVNEYLANDISAMDVMYRGDPSYEHDGYHMRSSIEKMVRNGYAIYTAEEVQTAYEAGRASRDAEVEALRADAERYRWLRDQHWVEPEARFRLGLSNESEDDAALYEQELNKAIDEARKEKQDD